MVIDFEALIREKGFKALAFWKMTAGGDASVGGSCYFEVEGYREFSALLPRRNQ
jgi:hypothetical protein